MYEKPSIQRLYTGLMNKFGSVPPKQRIRTHIDGVSIDDLVEEYGSPLFVFSERKIRNQHKRLRDAFAGLYPSVSFGWSYKTNYLKSICSIMHQEGSLAEVVSQMEYEKARALGIPGEEIIFNGPNKPMPILQRAVDEGAMIHVDHLDELDDLIFIAKKDKRQISVGIRLNLDAGISPQWSRFGFNLESGQAARAVERMYNSGHIRLTGLHCHIGTYITEPTAYGQQITKMAAFAQEMETRYGCNIEYIDIGGGLPSSARLKGTYLPPDVSIPPVERYAEVISDAMNAAFPHNQQPRLILEPGRAMIDESGLLITSVQARKRLADGTRSYVIDAGINFLYTSTWYKHGIEIDREVPGPSEHSVLYGPLCMNIDVVDEGISLPALDRGTRLIIGPVGAYSVTQWMQFIAYRPAVVLIDQQGTTHCIRGAEDLSDIELREELPAHVQIGQTKRPIAT